MSRWDSTCGNGKDMLRPTPCARAGRGRTKGRKSMPEYRENELCYEDYRALRTLAGWETHSEEQTRRALAAALYDVTAVEDGRAVCADIRGGVERGAFLVPFGHSQRSLFCAAAQGLRLRPTPRQGPEAPASRTLSATCAGRETGPLLRRKHGQRISSCAGPL